MKFEGLTVRQKIGMCFPLHLKNWPEGQIKEDLPFAISLIKEHALGALWVDPDLYHRDEVIGQLKAAADYPLIIMCDAEKGFDEFKIGRHNNIACTDEVGLAYTFGKCIAIAARKAGYNCLCNPVLDGCDGNFPCGAAIRSLGPDKVKRAEFAAALAQGMHDGGVLTVAKHYPSVITKFDTHMAQPIIHIDKQELIEENLYPYIELNKKGLLDGIMVGHVQIENLDSDYPASLSKKIINIIREQGFDGFAITDDLTMMGVVSRFGKEKSRGMSIEAGNDLALCWTENKQSFESLLQCYEDGCISDSALDRAARHVLQAQEKTLAAPKFTEVTEDDREQFDRIATKSVFGYFDKGVLPAVSKDGKHYFVIMVKNALKIGAGGKMDGELLKKEWYRPDIIREKLESVYVNSAVTYISELSSAEENKNILDTSVDYDDLVFITFFESGAYVGAERFNPPVLSLIEALQMTNRVSTLVHFGNPFLLEDMPHIPRVLVGCCSTQSVMSAMDVLSGDLPCAGKPVYDIKRK